MSKPTLHTDVERAISNANRKHKKRGPSAVMVGADTEFTDYLGIHLLFGLRRSTMYHLWASEPELKGASVSLASGEEKRGKRLWHVPTVRKFLNSRLPKQAQGQTEA